MKVTDVTKETCVVSWKPPTDNGGSPIERYVIEKQDVARGGWTPAGEVHGESTSLRLTKLTPGKEYLFRVRAVNKEGESEPLETTGATLAKNPFDEPSAPGQPDIADWDKDRVDLQWRAPVRVRGAARTYRTSRCVYRRRKMAVHRLRNTSSNDERKVVINGKRSVRRFVRETLTALVVPGCRDRR